MSEDREPQHSDEQVEDLDVTPTDAHEVKGGGKKKKPAGGDQQQYLEVKLEDTLISSY